MSTFYEVFLQAFCTFVLTFLLKYNLFTLKGSDLKTTNSWALKIHMLI